MLFLDDRFLISGSRSCLNGPILSVSNSFLSKFLLSGRKDVINVHIKLSDIRGLNYLIKFYTIFINKQDNSIKLKK